MPLDPWSQVPHRGSLCFGWRNGWSSDPQHKKSRAASRSSSGLSGYLQDCLHGSRSVAAGGPQGVRGEEQPAQGDGDNLASTADVCVCVEIQPEGWRVPEGAEGAEHAGGGGGAVCGSSAVRVWAPDPEVSAAGEPRLSTPLCCCSGRSACQSCCSFTTCWPGGVLRKVFPGRLQRGSVCGRLQRTARVERRARKQRGAAAHLFSVSSGSVVGAVGPVADQWGFHQSRCSPYIYISDSSIWLCRCWSTGESAPSTLPVIPDCRLTPLPVCLSLRLVYRQLYPLAIKVCHYLKIPDYHGVSRVLRHWASCKVRHLTWLQGCLSRVCFGYWEPCYLPGAAEGPVWRGHSTGCVPEGGRLAWIFLLSHCSKSVWMWTCWARHQGKWDL